MANKDFDFEDFNVPAYTIKEYKEAVEFLKFLKNVLRSMETHHEDPEKMRVVKKNIKILEDKINHLS